MRKYNVTHCMSWFLKVKSSLSKMFDLVSVSFKYLKQSFRDGLRNEAHTLT